MPLIVPPMGHFTAIRVDRAAVYVLNFRAGLHLKVGTLQPDRAGRAFRRIRFVSVASAGRDDRRVILDHAAGSITSLASPVARTADIPPKFRSTAPAPSVIVLGTVALEAMMASCT